MMEANEHAVNKYIYHWNAVSFFPSVSAGWRVSEEPFFKSIDALKFVNQLKLRASYGVLGDDGDLNYDWAMGYTYPATSGNMSQKNGCWGGFK